MRTAGKIILTIIFSFSCFLTQAQETVPASDKNNLIKTKKVWVFILAGQSNMAGRGEIEAQDTVTSARILGINDKDMGSMDSVYTATVPAHGVFVIKVDGKQAVLQEDFEAEYAWINNYNLTRFSNVLPGQGMMVTDASC